MDNLLKSIKHHEGFVDHVYDDSLGIPTIGYGFAIKDLVLEEDLCDADEMLDSKWAKQTPGRAKEMSDIIRSLHEEKSSTKGDSNT